MANTATGLTPVVESRAPEEQLAASAVLLRGDRPRSRKPPERVPMEPEVLRRLSRVKPLVSLIPTAVLEARNDCCRHTLDETIYEQIDHGAVVNARVSHPARTCRSASEHGRRRTGSLLGPVPICSNSEQPSRLLALPRRVR